jgi:uncharacterized membrane protein
MPAGLTVAVEVVVGPKEAAGLGMSGIVGGTSLTKGVGDFVLLKLLVILEVKMGGFLDGNELNL